MDAGHLEKLRRFALTAGLFLITYVAAGIAVDPHMSALGVSFTIGNPGLFPVGLVAASLWGGLRYGYYAVMLGASPYRVRRDLLDKLYVEWEKNPKLGPAVPGHRVPIYFGAREFVSSPMISDRVQVEQQARLLAAVFPKWLRARVTAKAVGHEFWNEEGEPHWSYEVQATIPRRCRLAALFEDFDYALPILLNAVALALFAFAFLR